MKNFLIINILLVCLNSFSQQVIHFEYDNAGNQIVREFCTGCSLRQTNETIKEISLLKEEDLLKFFPEDTISYYLNPVKEGLYLKWNLSSNNEVKNITIVSIQGQFIKETDNLEKHNNYLLLFQDFPTGLYLVNLNYKSGEVKSIKIIKN